MSADITDGAQTEGNLSRALDDLKSRGITVDVIDPETGKIIKTIATGANPHGLMYWPQPGRYSLGHNGNMR